MLPCSTFLDVRSCYACFSSSRMGLSELRPVLPDGFRAGEYSAFRCLPAISNGVEFGRYSMVFVRTSIRQSRKVIDYVTAQWRLISIRKNIDAAFTNFALVALPTMRITPRTINDSLNREEEPKPREPEVISNCTPFNIFGLPRHLDPMWFFERRTSDRIDDCRSAVLRRKSARARKCV